MSTVRVLVLCTGNSCRSQMAEGFLRSFDPAIEVHSAGTQPAPVTHPLAVEVMREAGVDISAGYPKLVDQFLDQPFDWVITVCGDAAETGPPFLGEVKNRVHIGFDDPARAQGGRDEVLPVFRRIRDEIQERFRQFYETELRKEIHST